MTIEKPYGEILDEMDHQSKYQPATVDPKREQELRIQALGAALSRRDWHAAERAYEAIRDKFYTVSASSPEQPASPKNLLRGRESVREIAHRHCTCTCRDDPEVLQNHTNLCDEISDAIREYAVLSFNAPAGGAK